MRIATWRVVLMAGAIMILAVAGIGFVAAANTPAAPAANVTLAEPSTPPGDGEHERPGPGEGERFGGHPGGPRGGRMLDAGRHLVHAEVTVTGRDGELINLQFDHGTVTAIGGGTLTISEAGGGSETVSTDDATKVHMGPEDADLGDVSVGDEVFVQSRIDGGTTLAKRIRIFPADAP